MYDLLSHTTWRDCWITNFSHLPTWCDCWIANTSTEWSQLLENLGQKFFAQHDYKIKVIIKIKKTGERTLGK